MDPKEELCPTCGDALVAIARVRLCRGCAMAFIVIAGPSEMRPADRTDVVINAIEASDSWLDDVNRIIQERNRNTAQLLSQRDQILADYEAMREDRNSHQRVAQQMMQERNEAQERVRKAEAIIDGIAAALMPPSIEGWRALQRAADRFMRPTQIDTVKDFRED